MGKKRILVPVDLIDDPAIQLQYASVIASALKWKICCIYVLENPSDPQISNLRREVEVKLAIATVKCLKDKEIDYEIIVTRGDLNKQLTRVSEELEASCVVADVRMFKRLLAFLSNSKLPCFTTTDNLSTWYSNLILLLDLSKPYLRNLEKGLQTAELLQLNLTIGAFSSTPPQPDDDEHQFQLENIRQFCTNKSILCTTTYYSSSSSMEQVIKLIQYAGDHGLIILFDNQGQGYLEKNNIPVMYFMHTQGEPDETISQLPLINI